MNTTQLSFLSGFNYGRTRNAVELTNREIGARWTDVDVAAFANGMLDALAGDHFRKNLMLSQTRGITLLGAA